MTRGSIDRETLGSSPPLASDRIHFGPKGQADEIAWPIAFLCSGIVSYICGSALDVNGGLHIT